MEKTFYISQKPISKKMQSVVCLLFGLLCFGSKCLFLLRKSTLTLLSDDIGDLASPVYLAGLDWSQVVNRSNYYGYGFKWIYFIFFKLTDNPRVIYYSIYLFQYLVMTVITVGFYYFYVRHFNKNKNSLMMALLLLFMMLNASVSFSSEGSVYFCFLLMLVIFFMVYESQTRVGRCLWSILLSFWLCYLMTLHERCLAVIIAVVLIIVFDWIYHRHCCVEPISFGISLTVFYWLEEKLTDNVLNTLWAQKAASGSINNTTVAIKNPLWFFESKEALVVFLKTGFSNLLTAICKSYGLWYVLFFMLVFGVFAFVFRQKVFKVIYEDNREAILGYLICIVTALIIIVGVAQRWGKGILNGGSRGPEYYYKGMTYIRYYKPFVLGSCALGIHLWKEVRNKIKTGWKYLGLFLLAASYSYFLWGLYPILQSNRNDTFSRFGFMQFENINDRYQVMACMIITLAFAHIIFCIRKKYWEPGVSTLLSVVIVLSTELYNVHYPLIKMRFENTVHFIDEVAVLAGLDKSEVYYYKTKSYGDSINEHTFQFSLPRYSIQYGWPEQEDVLVVSPSDNEALIKKGGITENAPYICLDKGVYIYIVGDDLCKTISSYGYEIQYD